MARRAWKCVFFCLIALIFLLYFQVVRSAVSDITYIYDELGRLVAVIDPAGDTAIYNYDAVGNLLSITRQSSSTVAVIEFTPDSAAIGSTVTIYGTGFSTTPSQNTVTFNGTAATVTSSTATKIVTSVPVGAFTGAIAVTTPSGTGTSATSFVVASSTGGPTISGFTPTIGTAGTTFTISGTNFETAPASNKVKLSSTATINSSATATSIVTSVPTRTGSGRISVTTPAGTVTSSNDFFVTPFPFIASDVAFTDRMSIGTTKNIPVSTSGKIAMVVFDGTAGQLVSFAVTSNGLTPGNIFIYKPDGNVLTSIGGFIGGSPFIDTLQLPVTGTYTIIVDPESTITGSLNMTIYNITHITGTTSIGGSAVVSSLSTPGQNATLTFSGSANQKVSFLCTSSSIANSSVRVVKPDGTYLFLATVFTSNKVIGVPVLPATGTYKLEIDPQGANTGSMTTTLYDAADAGETLTLGTSAAINITVPGQQAVYPFTGTSGQRISLQTLNVWNILGTIVIKKPDDSTLYSLGPFISGNRFTDQILLSATGTYKVIVDPDNDSLCGGSLIVHDSSDFLGGNLPINGSAIFVNLPNPGQNGYFGVTGTAGQQVTIHVTGNTIASVNVVLLKPDNTGLVSTVQSVSNFNLATVTFPTTGNYVIAINPPSTNTGSLTISITSP